MADQPTGVVVMAYGSPRGPEDVERYYTDIRRGRPPTAEQLADLRRRYEAIGGVSPLAERTEAQRAAIARQLDALAPGRYEVVLGLKHAEPTIEQAVAQLTSRGVSQVLGLVLAPHYSSMSVGGYLQRLHDAAASHGVDAAGVDSWATEPALVEFLAGEVAAKLRSMPAHTQVVFTAHSLPARIVDDGDPYPDELASTATAVATEAGLTAGSAIGDPAQLPAWTTAWQSAGRTPEPWLGPDIGELIDDLAGTGTEGVLVCACGFVADHLEVRYDLDIDARSRAEAAGLAFDRTACVNDDAAVMGALAARVHALTTRPVP